MVQWDHLLSLEPNSPQQFMFGTTKGDTNSCFEFCYFTEQCNMIIESECCCYASDFPTTDTYYFTMSSSNQNKVWLKRPVHGMSYNKKYIHKCVHAIFIGLKSKNGYFRRSYKNQNCNDVMGINAWKEYIFCMNLCHIYLGKFLVYTIMYIHDTRGMEYNQVF